MSFKSPGTIIRNYSVRNLRPERNDRLCYYRELFLRKLRSRFRFKEFSYEANYKFFKLAYEVGTSAVYLPSINLDNVNKYDALLVFNYEITNGVKTKNNLPLTIKPTPEEIKNSGGILPNEELEIGKDVVLFWTHSTNHMTDAAIIDKIYAKKLVDIDEVKDNIVTSSQTPIIISYRNKNNQNIDNLINLVVNNSMVGYISDQEIGNIKPFQLSFDAHNYMTALQSEKTSLTDEALSAFGFCNLGRGETAKKERLLTDEVKVESDATNEALFDYIHQLEEFAKRFEDCFKLKLTPLISINGAFVDLETGHKYYKIKGAGGSSEQLGEILSDYNKFSGNSVDFGRSANTFTQQNNANNDLESNYGPDTEDVNYNKNWLENLQLGNYTYIPYEPNGPTYTQSLFGNVWNFFIRGLDLYRTNDVNVLTNAQNIQNNNSNNYFTFSNQNNSPHPNLVNPSLPAFYRFVNYVARRNFNTLDNQYEHLFDIDENQPLTKQSLIKNLDNVFGEKAKDYQSTIKYYFYLLNTYIKISLSLSLPTLLIASFMASTYYFGLSNSVIDESVNSLFNVIDEYLPKEKTWLKIYNEKTQKYLDQYTEKTIDKKGFTKLGSALLYYLSKPFRAVSAAVKAGFVKSLSSLLNTKWVQKVGKYLLSFLIRNIIYVFSYRVSYSLLDFLTKEGSPLAKHYITTFNAALITGFISDQKDYRTGLKYALTTTLTHHLQTILYFANKLDRVEKNKIIRLLNRWNDSVLILFPKDLMAYFISSIIVDSVIKVILDPKEGFAMKTTKFFGSVLKNIGSFSFENFKRIINLIFGKAYETTKTLTLDKSSQYLSEHFDFMLNFLHDTTLKFYESIKDYLMMAKHPLMFIHKIKEENKNILIESEDNIINQNPIDLEKEKKEIEKEAKPIIKDFIKEMIKGEPFDVAAKNTIDNNLAVLNEEITQNLKVDINKDPENILSSDKENLISKFHLKNITPDILDYDEITNSLLYIELFLKHCNEKFKMPLDKTVIIKKYGITEVMKKLVYLADSSPEILIINNDATLVTKILQIRVLYNEICDSKVGKKFKLKSI